MDTAQPRTAEAPAGGDAGRDEGEAGGATDRALLVAATLGRRVIRTATVELEDADPVWSPGETVRAALSTASRSLAAVADAAIWVGLAVVPVLATVGIPIGLVRYGWRRRARVVASRAPGT